MGEIGKTIIAFLERDIIGMLLIVQKNYATNMKGGAPWRICEERLWRFGSAWFQRPWNIRIRPSNPLKPLLWPSKRGTVVLWPKLQWSVRRRFPWVSYIFLMACPSTWYWHITQMPWIHVLMRSIRFIIFLTIALFISNHHTDQSHIRNFENSNYVTGRSCKAKCYLSKWWGLHHRQVLHLLHCLYCLHQISWAFPWCNGALPTMLEQSHKVKQKIACRDAPSFPCHPFCLGPIPKRSTGNVKLGFIQLHHGQSPSENPWISHNLTWRKRTTCVADIETQALEWS